jgi:alpha-tubulin suppressor-like RCC1 family protein
VNRLIQIFSLSVFNYEASTDYHGGAFVALKHDGSAVAWGSSAFGGDSADNNLANLKKIYSNANYYGGAFAALTTDGRVITWGSAAAGGDSAGKDLTDVIEIFKNGGAFAALKKDGSVITWGNANYGGDSEGLDLTNVETIVSTASTFDGGAFAALKKDGSVVTWGRATMGADTSGLNLTNIRKIFSSGNAFAALTDGQVITWGNDVSSAANKDLTNVIDIISLEWAFVAVKADGAKVIWGRYDNKVDDVSQGVRFFSQGGVFAMIEDDGDVFVWGDDAYGGTDVTGLDFEAYDVITSSLEN